MNFYRFLPLLPVMGTLLLGTGCTKRLAPLNPAAPAPTMSEPATVTLRDIVGQVLLEGETIVPPFARVGIKSPYRAPVSKVNTTLGAAVSQGDVLIELSLPSAEAYHEQTKLALQQAETQANRINFPGSASPLLKHQKCSSHPSPPSYA